MKNKWNHFLHQAVSAFSRFMYMRNGMDELSCLLLILSLILHLIFGFTKFPVFIVFYYLGIVLISFRFLSKNRLKRQKENQFLLTFLKQIRSAFHIRQKRWLERKTHKYFQCPQCRQWLRLPAGKGRIEVHCVKCSKTFPRKT